MPDSRSSTDATRRALGLASPALAIGSLLALLLVVGGCATVAPEEKERLADPAMTFTSGGMADRHEEHVLENREGSNGAGSTVGGGCGCN